MPIAILVGAALLAGQVVPRPPAGPRHELMIADGYTAVPLKQTKSGYYWLVPCSCRGKPLQLLLDTGADTVALDMPAARKLGLKGGAPRRDVGFGKDGESDSEQYILGEFTVGGLKVFGQPVVATDLSALGKMIFLDGAGPVQGVLGDELLRRHAAVIDYPTSTLYLKSSWAAEGPRLTGQWQCVALDGGGKAAPPGVVPSIRVGVKDGVLHYTEGEMTQRFALHCDPAARPKRMDWYPTADSGDGILTGKYAGIYAVTADELTLCMCLKGDTLVRPAAFTTRPDSGHALFKFRRVR